MNQDNGSDKGCTAQRLEAAGHNEIPDPVGEEPLSAQSGNWQLATDY